jgi:hypothetical protein
MASVTMIALLLHDVAKPATRSVREDGHVTFYRHQEVALEMVKPKLKQLKFSEAEIDGILLLILEHYGAGVQGRRSGRPDHRGAPQERVRGASPEASLAAATTGSDRTGPGAASCTT